MSPDQRRATAGRRWPHKGNGSEGVASMQTRQERVAREAFAQTLAAEPQRLADERADAEMALVDWDEVAALLSAP